MSIFSTKTVTPDEARHILHAALDELIESIDEADPEDLDEMLDSIVAGNGIYWRTNFWVDRD